VSILLNLLSVGGAYGLVTLIFQDGHLQSLLGFTSFGALVPWVPLFTFVLLFGLSMDYHVFILSRVREHWAAGASAKEAIVTGIGRTAGVVSSAALIMFAVFSIFATLQMIDVKMLGVGLAAAVLIDATVVRGVVLPACLALLGERAWYLPRWLDWLPGRSLVCEGSPALRRAPALGTATAGAPGRGPDGDPPAALPAVSSAGLAATGQGSVRMS
jgi:putative drug exporter of the RND superfamily